MELRNIISFSLLSIAFVSSFFISEAAATSIKKSNTKNQELPVFQVSIRAAVIRHIGGLVPVSRCDFRISPVSKEVENKRRKEIIGAGLCGEAPNKPEMTSDKYEFTNRFIIWSIENYMYEQKANVVIDQENKKLDPKRLVRYVKTNLDGKCDTKLENGDWHITGITTFGRAIVMWDYPFKIEGSSKDIELSNDNGGVFNVDF